MFSPADPKYLIAAYSPEHSSSTPSQALPFPLTPEKLAPGFALVWSLTQLSAYRTPATLAAKSELPDRVPYRFVHPPLPLTQC